MKRTVRPVVAAGCLLGLVAAGSTAGAQASAPDRVEYLTDGKAVHEEACSVCHPLERSLSKTFDKAGWEKTIERMHDNGAEVSGAQRAQVVAYLLAKNTFEARCSVCHGTDRPLGKNKTAADWQATVQRMSGKKPGHLTDAEAADIATYLSITRPLP
ncbi:MAG: c-type cytochrome [Candidatus Methylomirabilia bacterium]